jgi:hypothetical protein
MQGTVEAVSIKEGKYGRMLGIKLGEIWYDVTKGSETPVKGDRVTFDAEQNEKGFWKARNLKVGGNGSSASTSASDRDDRITKEWAINAATALLAGKISRADVLKEAFIFHRLATDPAAWEKQKQILASFDEGENDE